MDVCKAKCRKSLRTFLEALLNKAHCTYTSFQDGTESYSFSFDEVGYPIACRKTQLNSLYFELNNQELVSCTLAFWHFYSTQLHFAFYDCCSFVPHCKKSDQILSSQDETRPGITNLSRFSDMANLLTVTWRPPHSSATSMQHTQARPSRK